MAKAEKIAQAAPKPPRRAVAAAVAPAGQVKLSPDDRLPDPIKRKPAVRVQARVLAAALKDVAAVVEARDAIPILSHVLFEALANDSGGGIVLTASDLDIWAVRELDSSDRDGPGSQDWLASVRPFALALPAKALLALVGEFDPEAMVTLTGPHENQTCATIAAGRSMFRLKVLPADDFPLPPRLEIASGFEMACSQLGDAFAAVEHAISTEETRYYLNGVYLHPAKNDVGGLDLRMAATDGSRLARVTSNAPDGAASFPAAIVARRTVALLDRLCAAAAKAAGEGAPPSVSIEANASGGLIRWCLPAGDGGSIEVIAKTIDGSFPDYERVVPADPPLRAMVNRAELAGAVKRVAVLVDSKTRAVSACFTPDLLTLTVTTPELGEAREELPCSYDGPEVTLGLNSKYWREALLALASDEIALGFSADPQGPVLLRGIGTAQEESDRIVQVLMPMRS